MLQGVGSISQAVAGWAVGSYTISFDAAQRGSGNAHQQNVEVLIDGTVVGTLTPAGPDYATYTTAAFNVTAGSHTITFQALDTAGGDNTALVDDVRVAAAGLAPGGAGFELPMLRREQLRVRPERHALDLLLRVGGHRQQRQRLYFFQSPRAEGVQVAFLQGVGSFSQAVAGWAAGSYTISFYAAQRGSGNASQQNFEVLVDGAVVGTFTPAGSSYAVSTTPAFTVIAGSHTITFEGLDSAGGDNTALVDAIKLTQVTTNHLYYSSQWQVIEERQNGTGTSNVTFQYVWGAGYVDELVLRDTYSGAVRVQTQRLYAQQDLNYNVTALVNTSGQVQERYLYDPYGDVTITDASWNPKSGNTSSFGWRYLFQTCPFIEVTGAGVAAVENGAVVWLEIKFRLKTSPSSNLNPKPRGEHRCAH